MKFVKGDDVFVLTKPEEEYIIIATNGYNKVLVKNLETGDTEWLAEDDVDFLNDIYDNYGWL